MAPKEGFLEFFQAKLQKQVRRFAQLQCVAREKKINAMWPSDATWWQRSGSILAQVMACCLTTPSHYLNQHWLIISEDLQHSPEVNFTQYIYPWHEFENHSPETQFPMVPVGTKRAASMPNISAICCWKAEWKGSMNISFMTESHYNTAWYNTIFYHQTSNIRNTKIPKLNVCFLSRLAVVFAQSIEARC